MTLRADDDAQLASLAPRWKRAPRRWGHPLHSICSYFAMFPPQVPSVFIRWLTEVGDVVYDPFSGRGTAPLEAVLNARIGLGSDANPLAEALTAAKVRIPSQCELDRRLAELEAGFEPTDVPVPDEISMLYSEETLRQITYLRGALRPRRRTDVFLRAIVLGLLHGNHSGQGATRSLSISMPNTFAMSPQYVRDYIQEHKLEAPRVNAFDLIRRRLLRLELPDSPIDGGRAWRQDARSAPSAWLKDHRARLIFTSPPYLEVIKYGKYNWVRLWFLGQSPVEVDHALVATASLERYRDFMKRSLTSLHPVLRDDGYACLVVGDVRRRSDGKTVNLARDVWESVAEPLGWHLHGIVGDRVPSGNKVSRIWGSGQGRATKVDRILVLSKSGAAPPRIGRMTWSQPRLAAQGG